MAIDRYTFLIYFYRWTPMRIFCVWWTQYLSSPAYFHTYSDLLSNAIFCAAAMSYFHLVITGMEWVHGVSWWPAMWEHGVAWRRTATSCFCLNKAVGNMWDKCAALSAVLLLWLVLCAINIVIPDRLHSVCIRDIDHCRLTMIPKRACQWSLSTTLDCGHAVYR